MTEVAVFGARGYLGRTLFALLADHPHVQTLHPVSTTVEGRAYGDVVTSMKHVGETRFMAPGDEAVTGADVVFLATDDAQAEQAISSLEEQPGASRQLVVDLSRAHRGMALGGDETWTYGLPELAGGVQKGDLRIANPGCYPTASLLAIGPALQAGLLGQGPLIVDGKSGVSGAGATPRNDLHFPEANESLRAYSVEEHDHQAEIQTAAAHLEATNGAQASQTADAAHGTEPSSQRPVRFVPHLVPQNRGLLATVYAPVEAGLEADEVQTVYEQAYPDEGPVQIVDEPNTSHVRGSNQAHLALTLDEATGLLVARCAIDNLVKGGAGSAVQNMNRALGFEENAGLPWAGVAP